MEKETYNIEESIEAQKEYLKELGNKNDHWMADSFKQGIGFAPRSGFCYYCHRQIYSDGGISVEKARTELTTGCPFCNHSFVD